MSKRAGGGHGHRKSDGKPWGTRSHGFRIPDELWAAAVAEAKERSETVTDVVNRALKRYVDAGIRKRNAPPPL